MTATVLLSELAALLGRPGAKGERWLMREHRRLTRDHGFPARLPTGWAWPRRLVEVWVESGAVVPANDDDADGLRRMLKAPSAAEESLIESQRAFLRQRMGGWR